MPLQRFLMLLLHGLLLHLVGRLERVECVQLLAGWAFHGELSPKTMLPRSCCSRRSYARSCSYPTSAYAPRPGALLPLVVACLRLLNPGQEIRGGAMGSGMSDRVGAKDATCYR